MSSIDFKLINVCMFKQSVTATVMNYLIYVYAIGRFDAIGSLWSQSYIQLGPTLSVIDRLDRSTR